MPNPNRLQPGNRWLNVQIPAALHLELDIRAAKLGLYRQKHVLVERLIREGLEREAIKEKLGRKEGR